MRAVHAPPLQRLFGLRKGPKEKILIFGTGAAGKTTYEQLRRQAKVVGFLDNDAGKHGKSLFNKTIYPPRALEELAYDRIVIASMHYEEIMKQLISELRVPPEKVEVSPAVLGGDPRSLGFQTSTIGARIEFARALKNDRAFRLAHLAAHYYENAAVKRQLRFL